MDASVLSGQATYTPRERRSVLWSVLGGYWLDFYNLLIISFTMSALTSTFGISLGQAGILTSVMLVTSLIGGVSFGWLADRYGRKRALLWALALFSIGAVVSAFSWDYTSLLVTRAIAGIGIGGEWGIGMVLFSEVYSSKRRGLGVAAIQGMSMAGLALAVLVSTFFALHLSPNWSWRASFLIGAAPVLLMIYVRITMPESKLWREYDELRRSGNLPETKARQRSSLVEIFKGVSLRYTLLGTLMVAGYMFGYWTVAQFMPTYMRDLHATPSAIRNATLIIAACGFVMFPFIGWASDVIGRAKVVIITGAVTLVAVAGIYFGAGSAEYAGNIFTWNVFWWYLLWTAIGAGSIAIFGSWLSELYPVELRSTAASTVYVVGRMASAAAIPIAAAVIAASDSTPLGMSVGVFGTLLMIVFALMLPETMGRQFKVLETKDVGVRSAPVNPGPAVEEPVPVDVQRLAGS